MQQDHLVVSERDPMTLATFEETIAEIEAGLFNLRFLASETNFDDPAQRQRYRDNIVQLKRFYERAERMALNEPENTPAANGGLDPQAPKKNVKVLKKR